MNSPHHPHHEHHDVHQQRLLWFFSFCNQRSSSSSNSSSAGSTHSHGGASRSRTNRRKSAANRNKFALQYQQQLQQQQRQSSNVFGLDLTEHTQKFSDDEPIPFIVKSCTRFIEKHGIIFGIYRLSGMRVNIHKLRQDFDKDPKISMIDNEAISNDAHAVACVLKQYFRELPTPLLTFHMYEKFIQLFKQSSTTDQHTNDKNQNRRDMNHQTKASLVIHKNAEENDDKFGNKKCNDQYGSEIADNNDDDLDINCGDSATTIRTKLKTPMLTTQNTIAKTTSIDAIGTEAKKLTSITHKPLISNSSIAQQQQQNISGCENITQKQQQTHSKNNQHFTTSASDSQLISLSSVVTTTTSDVTYQVKLDDLRKLLLQLPNAHYQTLKFLMRHLACIAENGQKTGMDSKNVAIVWAPNLLKPRELELTAGLETLQVIGLQAVITEQLIKHHEFLFDEGGGIDARQPEKICNITQTDSRD